MVLKKLTKQHVLVVPNERDSPLSATEDEELRQTMLDNVNRMTKAITIQVMKTDSWK